MTSDLKLREAPGAPTTDEWEIAIARQVVVTSEPEIDVIIPIYDGLAETLRCIYSVLNAPQVTPYHLVLINDCSPNPELVRWLEWLSGRGVGELVSNPENLGFPATCNRAMAMSERDVILLNSDTEVYHDWLDRFVEVARSSPRVGTITAMSNNATIASYPVWLEGSNDDLEISWERIDELARTLNRGVNVDVPTGIGFCMYISRQGLREVGDFDQVAFKVGYGEENDHCRRLAHAGFSNLIAGNIFVRHVGSVSFGKRRKKLSAQGMKALLVKHPDYNQLVGEIIARDPIAPIRRNLDMARIKMSSSYPPMIFVTHSWGGGIETHAQDMAARLESEGRTVLFCRPNGGDRRNLDVTSFHLGQFSTLSMMDFTHENGAFWEFLDQLGVANAHIHSLAGWEHNSPELLSRGLKKHQIPYDMTLHDYSPLCPQNHLVDSTDRFCTMPSVDICQMCCEATIHPDYIPDVQKWRDGFEFLMRDARKIFAPSGDTALRYQAKLPGLPVEIRPHSALTTDHVASKKKLKLPPKSNRRRVLLLGRVSTVKGIDVVVATANDAEARNLPLEFVIIGESSLGWFRKSSNIFVTGSYDQNEIDDLIKKVDGDLFWFPAIAPETYSYTLSSALDTGLNIVAFDIGAIAERLKAAHRGVLHPIEMMLDAPRLADALLEVPLNSGKEIRHGQAVAYESLVRDYYQLEGS